jgi:hypothetical protein
MVVIKSEGLGWEASHGLIMGFFRILDNHNSHSASWKIECDPETGDCVITVRTARRSLRKTFLLMKNAMNIISANPEVLVLAEMLYKPVPPDA